MPGIYLFIYIFIFFEVMEKKIQVSFSQDDDIKLLLEVAALNPFANRNKWTEVAERVSKAVERDNFSITARRARERTALLENFKRKNTESKNRLIT